MPLLNLREFRVLGAAVFAAGAAAGCTSSPSTPHDAGALVLPSPSVATATPTASAVRPPSKIAPGGPRIGIDQTALAYDVKTFAVERPPGTPGHAAVRERLVITLKRLGYAVAVEPFTSVAGPGFNVIARKKGTERESEHVILSAHYDHIPFCPGADDNASGVAAVLATAAALAKIDFPRSLDIAFWDQEENGLHGSSAYASSAALAKEDIVVAISLDGVGFASSAPRSQVLPPGFATMFPDVDARLEGRKYAADFIAFIGDDQATEAIGALEARAEQVSLPSVGLGLSVLRRVILNDVARSDHASFWLRGYSAILITDTANFRNPAYHCSAAIDHPGSLDYAFLARVTETVAGATHDLLQGRRPPRP